MKKECKTHHLHFEELENGHFKARDWYCGEKLFDKYWFCCQECLENYIKNKHCSTNNK